MSNKVVALIDRLVREALHEAGTSTGIRIKTERQLANEIARSLDEQEEEEEEEEAAAEEKPDEEEPAGETEEVPDILDTEEEAGGEEAEAEVDVEVTDEPEAEPKPKRKMAQPPIATGTTYKDFKHNFNIIRSARAISKTVEGEKMITKTGLRLRNYFEGLTDPEKKALQRFMVGLAQVLIAGKPADTAVHPDIKQTEKETVDVTVTEPSTSAQDVENQPPVRIVGSKLESMMKYKRKFFL